MRLKVHYFGYFVGDLGCFTAGRYGIHKVLGPSVADSQDESLPPALLFPLLAIVRDSAPLHWHQGADYADFARRLTDVYPPPELSTSLFTP